MAEDATLDPIITALFSYLNSMRDLCTTDSEASDLFGSDWRSMPRNVIANWRAREKELEIRADRALSAALKTPASNMAGIATKLRLAFCIASGCDWSSPIIRQLVLSAAIDASRLAAGRDREIERRYFGDCGSRDSLAMATARGTRQQRRNRC